MANEIFVRDATIDVVPEAMPPCFEKWCVKLNDIFTGSTQQSHFRTYLARLLGKGRRKNIAAIASSTVGALYYNLHHFLHDSPWDKQALNDRWLEIIWQCRQTRPGREFKLIICDSGHRKSGSATEGVRRQYRGQVGKVDNGVVEVTSRIFHEIGG